MRSILHLHIPDFPIAVARVVDPSLRGRPVAVAPQNGERGLLQAVSAEARSDGVREGMPVWRARRLCPPLSLLPPDPFLTARASAAMQGIVADYTPLWEPAAPGDLYLDLTGSGRLLGPGRDAAARLDREIGRRLRLGGAVGVAGNKLVSRIAAGYLQRAGVCDVLHGSEAVFLAPLPVALLPGVGAARQELLAELNLRRVGEVAALSAAQLRLPFGPFAPLLQQRARGIDPSPVRLPRQSLGLVEETVLPRAENDDALLLAELGRLVETCGFALRRQGRAAHTLLLTIGYEDGVSAERSHSFPAGEDRDRQLLAAAETLFLRACERRVRVKRLRLACTRLTPARRQLDLFADTDAKDERQDKLQRALDFLRDRHGMEVVKRKF